MTSEAWRRESHLCEAGAEATHALHLYELASQDGSIEPLVRWATSVRSERTALADAIVRLTASRTPPEDWELQFALYQAYELGISAGLDLAGRFAERFRHMRLAALASGHPRLLSTVAYHYWHGLNEVTPDEREAERWFALSARTGDSDALRSYAQFQSRVQPATLNPSATGE